MSNVPTNSAVHSHRNSPVPTWPMVSAKFMELRKRRGLMIALVSVNVGLPSLFLLIRLISHAVAPHSYGPAGGYEVFGSLIVAVMYLLGFIVAATLGASAGSADYTEGVFRHLVITGRSRVALYFARIPAGLMIIIPVVALGITIVSTVCVMAAPTSSSYDGLSGLPAGMSKAAFVSWAEHHPTQALCGMGNPIQKQSGTQIVCGPNNAIIEVHQSNGLISTTPATSAEITEGAVVSAKLNYVGYSKTFLSPSLKLILETGLWTELWAALGYVVGLGLSSLMGQRTVPMVLLVVYEIILSPLLSRAQIPHLINVQRSMLGLAMARIEPGALPSIVNGQGGKPLSESLGVSIIVIAGWVLVWTALGAWRMARRDA